MVDTSAADELPSVFKDCHIDLSGAGYLCVFRTNGVGMMGVYNEGDKVLGDGKRFDFEGLNILSNAALAKEVSDALAAQAAELTALRAERDELSVDYSGMALEAFNRAQERDAALARVGVLKDALEYYADEVMAYSITQMSEPRSAVHADKGRRARATLAALTKEGE